MDEGMPIPELEEGGSECFAVGAFLDIVNESFIGIRVSLRGEVFGIEERRGILYFSLRDSSGDGMVSCILFRRDASYPEHSLVDGAEVVVDGMPHIWKPRGKFSFRASRIRRAGDGAIRKAYEELKLKLSREGVFDADRKRSVPGFPRRVALLTSRDGAAIGDFMANIDRRGFHVVLRDIHVEGSRSVQDILDGMAFFNACSEQWDVLVLIRGGGSLESLESYNDERVVRSIASSRIPTIVGVGHEKDISLSALVADLSVSTPTAAARAIGTSWEKASEHLSSLEIAVFDRFGRILDSANGRMRILFEMLRDPETLLETPLAKADRLFDRIFSSFVKQLKQALSVHDAVPFSISKFQAALLVEKKHLLTMESAVQARDPKELLRRGYSLLKKNGRLVKSASSFGEGDTFEAVLSDGSLAARVISVSSRRRDRPA